MVDQFKLRMPCPEDGPAIHDLASRCPPLDCNSLYCNLLQTSHFRDTAIVAEQQGEICGYVTGYRLPGKPETLFVWQVAVSPAARGQGLASTMLEALLSRFPDVAYLETTVTPNNESSMKLFRRLAERSNTILHKSVLFERKKHFAGEHEDEILLRIGPLEQMPANKTPTDNADDTDQFETIHRQLSRMIARAE